MGFVLADLHIVTCAHVVNVALGRDKHDQVAPGRDELIQVDFPILGGAADRVARNCRVIAWKPPAVMGISSGDIAVLQIVDGGLPPGAGRARLMDPGAVRYARVAVFGYPQYPEPRPEGGWAWLRVSGGVGGGLTQLDAAGEAAFRAQPGYSGSPVVASDAAGDAVIGIFSAASADGQDPDSYAIPSSALIDAWPDAWPEAIHALSEPARGYRVDPYGDNFQESVRQETVRELPLAPQDFSGRADEIQRLTGWLTAVRSPRLVNIYGIPGSGKTALALRVAQDVGAQYPDCQLHFDLRSSDQSPVSVDSLLGRKLVQLGVPVSEIPTGLEARVEAYRSGIARRRSLIVVDNVTSVEQVRLLLPGYSDSAVIVTSWTLIPELGPHALRLQPLNDDEAVAMLAAVSNRAITEDDRDAVLRVAQVLGNLPLALRIAGGLMRTRELWTWAKLLDRIRAESANSRARPLVIGSPEVQASFGLAYAVLMPDIAQGYRLLGLAPSARMSRDFAQALISGDPEEAEDVIDQLVAHQFLQSESGSTFRMHNLLWLRARALVAEEPDRETRRAAIERLTASSLNQLHTRYLDQVSSGLSILPPIPGAKKPLSLPETYVESKLAAARQADWLSGDMLASVFPSRRDRLVLMAPGGAGKTTMVGHLCLTAAAKHQDGLPSDSEMWIPLVVLLRDIRPDAAETDVESLIISTLRYRYECELTREALETALDDGQVFLVADGFDELIEPALRRRVMRSINDFAARYPRVPVLVTTRPFAEVYDAFPEFTVATISPWDMGRARTYLEKLASTRKRDSGISSLLEELSRKKDIGAIGTPLGLQMLLSRFWYFGDIPETFTVLMQGLIGLITGTREGSRGLALDPAGPQSATRASAEAIAFAMQSRSDNRTTISQRSIMQALVSANLAVFPEDGPEDLKFMASQVARRVTSPRGGFMRQIGVTPEGRPSYAFEHTAYREHLAASHLARMDPDGIVAVMRSHFADPSWEAVFVAALELGRMGRGRSFLREVESAAAGEPELRLAIRSWEEKARGRP